MTIIPPLPKNDEDDLLAAEYVSGLLDLAERSAVEIRLRNDPVFLARIDLWQSHFAGLNDGYAEAPAPNLLPQIEARLFPTPPRHTILDRFLVWATAAAAALAMVTYLALTPPAPDLVATLTTDAGALRFEAVITDGQLTITRVAGPEADAAHSHELWIIAGENPPVSLGVLPDDQEVISLPGAASGAVLAVTEEQAGGSPDGKPHGPILAKGALTLPA